MLRYLPALTIVVMIGPVIAGMIGTFLPAFGYLPALGGTMLSLDPWRDLLATPGLDRSVAVSLLVGFSTTLVSLATVVLITAASHGTRGFAFVRRVLSPLLAVPHVAIAVGLAFVIAPSGLLFRLFAATTGWPARPPDLLIVNDTWGLSLMGALLLKEIPFLFLMLLAALPQADADRSLTVARSLGYGRVAAWLKVVLPRIYPQIRLPVLAVLAYGISVVDVALVLGPTTPPTLPVQILRWINDPDLMMRFKAAAGGVLQVALVAGAIVVWVIGERLLALIASRWLEAGGRQAGERTAAMLAGVVGSGLLIIVTLAAISIVLWSFAEIWRYPQPVPATWSTNNWISEGPRAADLIFNSLVIAVLSSGIAVALVIGCLEKEVRYGRSLAERAGLWILYLPLIAPQIAYLLGIQIVLVQLALDETLTAVVLTHIVFVLPYVFLSLSDPWRAYDDRYRIVALGLGASPGRALIAVRLPMLLRAVLTAFAIGAAVSIGQYLATALVAGARWPTITTEAITISSGGNRRVLAIYALLQMLIPLAAVTAALAIPALVFRNRRALRTA